MLPDIFDDINQDGVWDVLDIILAVGYIMETNFLNENQQLYRYVKDLKVVHRPEYQ